MERRWKIKVENVVLKTKGLQENVLTTKSLQDGNIQLLDGTTVENKGKKIN